MTTVHAPRAFAPPKPLTTAPQRPLLMAGGVGTAVLVVTVAANHGLQQAGILVVGLLLGLTLFHSRFGFTSAWRQVASVGQSAGIRAHILMLAVAVVAFAVLFTVGTGLFGDELAPGGSPLGVSLVIGAVLFGIGMQLGGACASGSLFAVGSGHSTVMITLTSFIAGSVIGAWHWGFWVSDAVPAFEPVVLGQTGLGIGGAALVSLLALGGVLLIAQLITSRRNPPPVDSVPTASGWVRVLRGSWPLWVGAILLGLLNAAMLAVSGRPWGVTAAFALWGSKVAEAIGINVRSWAYWSDPAALDQSILADVTSVANIGIILGAFLAAAAAGSFSFHTSIPPKTVLAAVTGGLLMGYGARLAPGCNIGAYFSGIAQGSLHGWAWGGLAMIGTVFGLKLRPLFGLTNPKPTDSVC